MIEFEVAHVNDQPGRSRDSQPYCIRDRMADVEEFHVKGTDLYRVAGFHRVQHGFGNIVARQLDFDQSSCQRGGIHRRGGNVQKMVDCSNMIFMTVGNDNANHLIGFLTQIFKIGNDVIDPEHIVFGEHDSGIHHQDLVLEFIGSHVLAHFPEPAQGNDLQFSVLTHTSIFILTWLKNIFIRQWRLRSVS